MPVYQSVCRFGPEYSTCTTKRLTSLVFDETFHLLDELTLNSVQVSMVHMMKMKDSGNPLTFHQHPQQVKVFTKSKC